MNKKQMRQKLIELEEEGKVIYDIGHRGGKYGLLAKDVFEILNFPEKDRIESNFPEKIGVYCNYLGGGLRGAIVGGGYNENVRDTISKRIELFYQACEKRYEELENDGIEPDEWNDEGTRRCRRSGIISAY